MIYQLSYRADEIAKNLKSAIHEAQSFYNKLEKFADDGQNIAELAASSDRFPNYSNTPPTDSGLTRIEKDDD